MQTLFPFSSQALIWEDTAAFVGELSRTSETGRSKSRHPVCVLFTLAAHTHPLSRHHFLLLLKACELRETGMLTCWAAQLSGAFVPFLIRVSFLSVCRLRIQKLLRLHFHFSHGQAVTSLGYGLRRLRLRLHFPSFPCPIRRVPALFMELLPVIMLTHADLDASGSFREQIAAALQQATHS